MGGRRGFWKLARRDPAHRPTVRKLRRWPPARLGIHPAIAADGAGERGRGCAWLTRYVPRDHDPVLRRRLAEAASIGGFVLLVGASSTGKTRSAYEAALAVLPGWRLMTVDPAYGVDQLTDFPRRTILWLDDIQRYLAEGGAGLTRGKLLTLIHRHRAVVLGTMWPEHLPPLAAPPGRGLAGGAHVPDVHSTARDLLALAGEPIHVPDRLSEAERERAVRVAAVDPRVRAALADPDVGFTQALAGAGELVRHWRRADPYAQAVIDAAVDCRRLGVHGPLDEELLRACASALLTVTPHTASVPGWFERAIEYATRAPGGTSGVLTLLPQPRARRRQDGPVPRWYRLADSVFQHGLRQRFDEPLPMPLLKTLVTRVEAGPDLLRVAHALHVRGLHSLAEQLYRRGSQAGDPGCRRGLARLLVEQGDPGKAAALLAEAPADDRYSHLLRLQILHDHGDAAALARLADADVEAAWWLGALRHARGDDDGAVAQLHRLWRAGVYGAALPLADLLARTGRYDELAELATADCVEASLYLLTTEDALAWRDAKAAEQELDPVRAQSLRPYGDPQLRREWLAARVAAGQADEALGVLRKLAVFGERAAHRQLCQLLHDLGRLDELRTMAEEGDALAGWLVADLLAAQGRGQELQVLAERGNPNARATVAAGLARQGRAVEAGRWLDVRVLTRILLAHGHAEAARRHATALADSPVPGDRLLWARILAEVGERESAVRLLTALAAAGAVEAGEELVALVVAGDGDVEAELRRLARCGVTAARRALIEHLGRVGRVEEADRVRVHGLHPDGSTPQ